jgi:acetoin utilization deacetylase AcuC-like enzyme
VNGLSYYYPEGHEAHFERSHPERPERIEVIRAALDEAGLWQPYPKLPPLTLDDELIRSIHNPDYLTLLEMACRGSYHLDADTYTTLASWDLAHRAAGGAAAVTKSVWRGESQAGFALCRPPGHHATRGQGMGFCLLNNIALAAEYLIRREGAKRLVIVDLDLHHGNGTQDIFWERGDVLFCSVHQERRVRLDG